MAGRSRSEAAKKGVEPVSVEALTKMLECPVCLEVCLPPVYQCLIGHTVCGDCRTKLDKCGVCRSPFGKSRNFLHETLSEGIMVPCKYAGEGCRKLTLGKEIKDHHAVCLFRPVGCFVGGCLFNTKKTIPYSKYLHHLHDKHRLNIWPLRCGRLRNPCKDVAIGEYFYWPSMVLMFDGHTFVINSGTQDSHIYVWARYFGIVGDAQKFRLELKLGHASTGCKLSWEGPVNPIGISSTDLCKEGKCWITTTDGIKLFVKEGETGPYWEFDFEIKEVP